MNIDDDNNNKRIKERRQEDCLRNSSIEDTLKFLIETLGLLNHVISHDTKDNKDSILQVLEELHKVPIEDIIRTLTELKGQNAIWEGITDRLANHSKVKISSKDMDFVIAELIAEAYKNIQHKNKYAVLYEWGKWILLVGLGGTLWKLITVGSEVLSQLSGLSG